jgi:inorganic pyrophosphatase
MSLNNVTPGKNVPDTFNVVIEIPMNADPIKYEVDKESGAIFVDRFMTTAMHYPTNYGYVPQTLSGDGDPVDVLVITPYPLHPGVVVTCRPLGILMMEDEAGVDGKVIAVPTSKILPMYDHWKTIDDVNAMRRNAIATSSSTTRTWKRQVGQGAGLGRYRLGQEGNQRRHRQLPKEPGLSRFNPIFESNDAQALY